MPGLLEYAPQAEMGLLGQDWRGQGATVRGLLSGSSDGGGLLGSVGDWFSMVGENIASKAPVAYARTINTPAHGLSGKMLYPLMLGSNAALDTLGALGQMQPASPAAKFAAFAGAGAKAGGDIIDLRATLERRMLDEFRRRNLAELAQQGYYGTTQFSNGWSIGRYVGPDEVGERTRYVLMSPQGGAALYGSSIEDLMSRGFVRGEPVSVVGGERPPPPQTPGGNVYRLAR
jgi:hypothetical protein